MKTMNFDRYSIEDITEMNKMVQFLILRGYTFSVKRSNVSAPIMILTIDEWNESEEPDEVMDML